MTKAEVIALAFRAFVKSYVGILAYRVLARQKGGGA